MSAVAELLQSHEEAQFSLLLNSAPVGMALCQATGEIISSNAVFDELVSWQADPTRCALPELIHGGSETSLLISELFDGKRDSFQIECPAWGRESKSLRWTVWALLGDHHGPN